MEITLGNKTLVVDDSKKYTVTKGNATPEVFDTYEQAKAYHEKHFGSVLHMFIKK